MTPDHRPEGTDRPAQTGARGDEGFAIVFSMMFVLIIATFSLLLLSQLTSEVAQTQYAAKHQQTVNSAGAGLNAGLNRLRNATSATSGNGVVAYLPCPLGSNHATLTGTVNAPGTQTWTTDIYYLTSDPSSMTPAQVNTAAMSCPLSTVPSYAYLQSSGRQAAVPGRAATAGDRTVHATYRFTTSNAIGNGGQISYSGRCWDVGSSPTVGTRVSWQTCQVAGTPSQTWYYRPDLTLLWQGNPGQNLCLDYRRFPTADAIKYLTLQSCIGTGESGTAYDTLNGTYYYPGQQYQEFSSNYQGWSWNDVDATGDRGTACVTSYNAGTGNYGDGSAGSQLVMTATAAQCVTSATSSQPSATVGAGGAAGVYTGQPGPSGQLVSYAFFSRCLDVKQSDPAKGLIHYPCHQAPDPGLIEGNEQFQYSGDSTTPGTITTVRTDGSAGGNYPTVCLQSGGSTITLVTCVAGRSSQQWTMTGVVPGRYVDSYVIKDYVGKCIQADPNGSFGKILLATCSGADRQKWNAPAGGAQSQLQSVGEN